MIMGSSNTRSNNKTKNKRNETKQFLKYIFVPQGTFHFWKSVNWIVHLNYLEVNTNNDHYEFDFVTNKFFR